MFNPENKKDEDFGKSIWGKILLNELKQEILDGEKTLRIVQNKMIKFIELDKFTDIINADIEVLRSFENAINTSWNNAVEFFGDFKNKFSRWPTDKKVVLALKDEAKDIRTKVRDKIKKVANTMLLYNSDDAYRDIFEMYEPMSYLRDLVFDFINSYTAEKKDKNIIDFNDIEHYALKILVKKDENGNLVKTETAKRYTEKFVEIAIDEYQDSNRIQEEILTSVSNGKNLFMVGDVKQSIYKFRKACPELFLEKYENYSLGGNDKGLKIQLFKNFRSRKSVLDINNNIFESIMSKDLGDIDYNKDEFLNLGASFEESEDLKEPEVYVLDTKNVGIEEDFFDDEKDEIQENVDFEINQMAKEEIESKFVAQKINEMIENKIIVTDKKVGKRPIKYKDIVILLRSTKSADIYERELINNNIPVFTDGGAEYLETVEISTIMNLLKILDNPLDDIPLVSVLRSMLFKFTDNELITIRLVNRNVRFWKSIEEALIKLDDKDLKEKLNDFKFKIEEWRKESEYMPLSELIWKIYVETGYYNYVSLMPNGALRQANLKMLFERARDYEKTSFKGLFNFIRFIERLRVGSSDLSSAKIIGENEDVVRIMSIHKSKGLEFPIVFLCNSNKKINLEDLKGDILFHKDIGIGPEYKNYERMIEYSTAAKQAIKLKLKEENISEEMRVLYVALTRAKEKLIITAVKKEEQKNLDKKKDELEVYIKGNKINPILLKKYSTYLDWIELTYLKNKILEDDETFKFNILDVKDFVTDSKENIAEEKSIDFSEYNQFDKLEQILNWKYKDLFKTTLPIKSTVSEVKRIKNNKEAIDDIQLTENEKSLEEYVGNQFINQEKIGLSNIVTDFMQETKIDSARIGTLTHLVLQKIDFNTIYTKESLNDFIEELVAKNFLIEKEAKKIDIEKIYNFLNSDFAKKIKDAKKVYKEKPFYMKIKAKDFIENAKDEEVLVQGIIDLFFEDKDGKIILVDYKTDYLKQGEEENLVKKYRYQLELYKKAVEEAVNKAVSEVYLYSLYLNKEIEADFRKIK